MVSISNIILHNKKGSTILKVAIISIAFILVYTSIYGVIQYSTTVHPDRIGDSVVFFDKHDVGLYSSLSNDKGALPSAMHSKTSVSGEGPKAKNTFMDEIHEMVSCKINELKKLSIRKEKDDDFSVRFISSSKTARCPRTNFTATDPSCPRTWLLSFPGSGNTWTRHILQQLTGYPTGSIYKDGNLRNNGFPFENKTEGVIAIKAHSLFGILQKKNMKIDQTKDRVLLVIRNPYYSYMAEYKRGRLQLKHKGNTFIDTSTDLWHAYIEKVVPKWSMVIRSFLKLKCDKLIVFYEDLQSELLRQLVRMANFIRTPTIKEFAFCCTLYQSEGDYRRAPSNQTAEDVYTEDKKKKINSMLLDLAHDFQKTLPRVSKRLLRYRMPTN